MQHNIAIVVAAYNRPDSLKRLLCSLSNANYNGYKSIKLIVSVDFSGNDDCKNIANAFEWKYGEKEVIVFIENLGLKNHIISCGDYSKLYDGVIVLEDDLFVAQCFYDYAQQAFAFYNNDNGIAGIALYNYRYNELAHCPFEPIVDNHDNYFLQVPCSWGQLWTKKQWLSFKDYLLDETFENENILLPPAVKNWPVVTSWKRTFYKFMVYSSKYFVYPRISLSTNFGDSGTHFSNPEYVWQTPILMGIKIFRFSNLNESICIYDSYYELDIKSYRRIIGDDEISVSFDLNGIKPINTISTKYLISSKKCNAPNITYLPNLYPYESNIIYNLTGVKNNNLIFSYGEKYLFEDELTGNRIEEDIRRTLPHMGYLLDLGKAEVYKSLAYKLGNKVLKLISLPRYFKSKIFKSNLH